MVVSVQSGLKITPKVCLTRREVETVFERWLSDVKAGTPFDPNLPAPTYAETFMEYAQDIKRERGEASE